MDRININKIQEKDYLYNSCNLYYDKYFNSDDKGQLKSFEREIWMIGSEIIDNIKRKKIEKKNSYRYFIRRTIEGNRRR